MDIAEFVKARLGEDEAMARRNIGAAPGSSNGLGDTEEHGPSYPQYPTYQDDEVEAADDYLDRFRPLRQLREVAAKRKIFWDHTPKTTGRRTTCSRCHYGNVLGANWPCLTMTSLAGIWSDHPDFDPNWRP